MLHVFSFQPIQLSSLTVLNHSDVSKFELFILSQRAATDEISLTDSLPQFERKWKIKKISMFNELVKWRDERGTALTHCRPHGEDFGLFPWRADPPATRSNRAGRHVDVMPTLIRAWSKSPHAFQNTKRNLPLFYAFLILVYSEEVDSSCCSFDFIRKEIVFKWL